MVAIRHKILWVLAIASFPVMLSFQNCAKTQNFQATDVAPELTKSAAAPVDSETLPLNEEVVVDETNNQVSSGGGSGGSTGGSSGSGSSEGGEVRYQVEDPGLEHEKDIEEALAACSAIQQNESNNPQPDAILDADSGLYKVEGLRGNKILSAADFNGQSNIKSISNSFGHLILCGLNIDEVYKTGGKIIAVGTHIKKVTSHYGSIDLLNGSVVVDSSNVKIYRSEK